MVAETKAECALISGGILHKPPREITAGAEVGWWNQAAGRFQSLPAVSIWEDASVRSGLRATNLQRVRCRRRLGRALQSRTHFPCGKRYWRSSSKHPPHF